MTPEPRREESPTEAPLPKRPISNRAILGALLMVIVITMALLYWLLTSRLEKAANLSNAHGNLRDVTLQLLSFEDEYGRFPDSSTAIAVKESVGTRLPLGDSSSNQLFRQLIATVGKSEKIFWAKTTPTGEKPDNNIDSAKALAPGECSFTYVAGLSSADTGAPVIMTPLIPGTTRFDPKPFGGKALVVFIGTSSTAIPIEPDGRVLVNGRDLFDPAQPYWRGIPPDLKWPE
jgi:hypothetical protein